ncbi:Natural resistance-associated macrophage protein [Popillia japonica]|uniref:Natural resistance-associated macrophage protein n=1 Tax=Popillia japonica TaxID=7064 RepID=A0AAW1N4J1_POPJA
MKSDKDSPEMGASAKGGEDPAASGTELRRSNSYYAGRRITIPDSDNKFSFKKLWAFTGPGFLMSIAYLDPGNIESDLRSGSLAGYGLLWVLVLSSVMGVFVQVLSLRLGVVTGFHLAETCYKQYRLLPRIILWIMVEIAIIASDAQQVIGTSIAIYLISDEHIPLWGAAIITILDTFTFLCCDKYGLRKLETIFGLFISVMGITFGYHYVISQPEHLKVLQGLFVPIYTPHEYKVFLQGVGIVGAVIMPHNIYLHSALVKSREVDKSDRMKVKEAITYFAIESSVAVFFSILINICVVAVFAKSFYRVTNKEILEHCPKQFGNDSIIPNDDNLIEANLHVGGLVLSCTYGVASKYIWGIGILASGQSATMTGTYAGQFAMEGFLNLQWARWIMVLVTRSLALITIFTQIVSPDPHPFRSNFYTNRGSLALIPTLFVAIFTRIEELTLMNDLMNVINCLQLPFAVIPLIAFTSNRQTMGENFVNCWINRIIAISLSVIVITVNGYFVITSLADIQPHILVMFFAGVFALIYLILCVYLGIHMVVSMSKTDYTQNKFIKNYIVLPTVGYSSF